MSISDNYVPARTLGNGVTTIFSDTWPILANAFLEVFLENVTTGVQVLQTEGPDYAVTTSDDTGFSITMVVAPPATEFLLLSRNVTQNQIVPYETSKGFQGGVHEGSYDKLTAIVQELQDQVDRSIKFKLTSVLSAEIEEPVANKGVLWDSSGVNLINSTDDFNDIVTDSAASAAAALVSETNAASSASAASTSASNAATSETNAAADAVSTAADVLLTNADVVSTNADVVLTNADVVLTNADVVLTNADVVLTNADVVSTNAASSAVANPWLFDTSTDTASDPGTGDIRLNNVTISSVTEIGLSALTADTGNPDVSDYIVTWDDSDSTLKGTIIIKKSSAPATFAIFTVSGAVIDSGAFLRVPVTHVDSNGTFGANDKLHTQFIRTGDKGDTGAAGGGGGGAWELIATQTASASSSIDFTTGISSSTHEKMMLVLHDVVVATNAVDIQFFVSTDGGTIYTSTSAGHYARLRSGISTYLGTGGILIGTLFISASSNTGRAVNGFAYLSNDATSDNDFHVQSQFTAEDSGGDKMLHIGHSQINSPTAPVDAIRVIASSGNLASGRFSLYGLVHV